jgi:uncharacterized protein DUF5132
MALLEDVLGGWTGGVLVGLGAAVVGPAIFPAAGSILRPVAKTLVKGGLVVTDGVRGVVAEASEHVNDLVAEVRADNDTRANRTRSERRAAPSPLHQPH